ncbi:MAG: hypothetical protein ACLQBY_13140 [Solirubrobacteraceae bacterium]
MLVCADVALNALPDVDGQGRLYVPESERRAAEAAIEATANLMSLTSGCGRSISSPSLALAFRAEDDEDKRFISTLTAVDGADKGIAFGRLSVYVEEAVLASLADRDDGVALLAEALTQSHPAGRFRELLRVFEQGFAESADRLVLPLADFLALRPRLGFSKTEVKRWVIRLRGPATHADRHAPVLEADLRGVVDRMLLAAYEVLLNKESWHRSDLSRRELWTPTTGPLDEHGAWFVMQHRTEAPLQAQLYDPYGAYPLNLGAAGLQLDERCWPRRGPAEMTTREQPIAIIPAPALAVSGS